MNVLLECACCLMMFIAFTLGFFTGSGRREKPMLPIEPAVPDRIKQLEYEADQKAFADCMNYSIDVAYGGKE